MRSWICHYVFLVSFYLVWLKDFECHRPTVLSFMSLECQFYLFHFVETYQVPYSSYFLVIVSNYNQDGLWIWYLWWYPVPTGRTMYRYLPLWKKWILYSITGVRGGGGTWQSREAPRDSDSEVTNWFIAVLMWTRWRVRAPPGPPPATGWEPRSPSRSRTSTSIPRWGVRYIRWRLFGPKNTGILSLPEKYF